MAFRIQLRNDTQANWSQVNPVLLQGEPAFENDTNLLKIGNGASGYVSLPYFYGTVKGVNGLTGSIGITGGTGISVSTGSQIVITENKPYTYYVSNMSASGTSDPTVSVLESDLPATLTWDWGSTGYYVGTLTAGSTGAFGPTAGNVMIRANQSSANTVHGTYINSNSVSLTHTGVTGDLVNGLSNCFVEIRIY
jgi:hypothetical protein